MSSVMFSASANIKMADVVFSSRAYCKMILHCAKYSHCAVNGVLLATAQSAKDPKGAITFTDAIPLFHICLNVTPMYETAMSQIDHMASTKGLVIAGYYHAEENYSDVSSDSAMRVVNKISEYFPSPCLVTIDNRRFPSIYDGHKGENGKDLPLIVTQSVEGKGFKRKDRSCIIVADETIEKADCLLVEKMKEVIDFDNHLDDLRLDWRNPTLNQAIDC